MFVIRRLCLREKGGYADQASSLNRLPMLTRLFADFN